MPFTDEFWTASALETEAVDQGAGVDVSSLRAAWDQMVNEAMAEATLQRPVAVKRYVPEGKRGVHSEYLSYLLGEMQSLARQHPGAVW
jgi:ring-1,2-phenylacetyl-CoA epoxidase subunit PaaC